MVLFNQDSAEVCVRSVIERFAGQLPRVLSRRLSQMQFVGVCVQNYAEVIHSLQCRNMLSALGCCCCHSKYGEIKLFGLRAPALLCFRCILQ